MMRVRLTIVQTHPVQYMAPWFRYIARHCPEIQLTVLYASRPKPEQQGVGFDRAFEWDTSLLDGYDWTIVRESVPADDFSTKSYRGLDVDGIGTALARTKPDVVLVPGWYSITLTRAILWARAHGIPVIYRGDTNNDMAPRGWRAPLWHLKTRALLSLYSGYLSVGSRAREYLRRHGAPATRIHASPACVDNAAFASAVEPHLTPEARTAARARVGAGIDDFVVLFAGKLEAKKRPLDAVEAVAGLGPRAVLVVAGSGPLAADVDARASQLGIRLASVGFINQSRLGEIYAAADCLVLPSDQNESWGLVVNEAMATGLPVAVSDHVGCVPDLVVPGQTGEVHRAGDIEGLRQALERVRAAGGRAAMSAACRERASRHDFAAATAGLAAACRSLAQAPDQTRVVACCGGMVIVSGLERMTFEVLRVARDSGGSVHCVVNSWENHRIVELSERIGASWSPGFYMYEFGSRPRSLKQAVQMLWDVIRTSASLVRAAIAFRPTHVLAPETIAVVRNAPALAVLRLLGVDVVLRLATVPERGRVQRLLWRYVLPPFVTRFVPNSRFSYGRLLEEGVEERKITLIRNGLSRRPASPAMEQDIIALARSRPTLLTVGQIAPFKGTHLAVDAALQLRREGVDVQAIILGALPTWPPEFAEYAADLRARVEAAGAGDRVIFAGVRENVLELMKASYVLSAPILQEETFGNVVLEARSVGLPVVTFPRGGLPELIEHGVTGYVCDTTDLSGLLAGLRHYLNDPKARETASANCLKVTLSPENDCTVSEFNRRWSAVFAC